MEHPAFTRWIGRWPYPRDPFSYELQRRLVKAAVQNPFLESVQTIAELTGVSVSKRSLEEILPDATQDFDAFYRQRSAAPATGSIFGGGGRWQGHSHGQARRCAAHSATDQRAEGQQETHGHGGDRCSTRTTSCRGTE